MKHGYTYILGSPTGVLYIGVTSTLGLRIFQHKNGTFEGFSKTYNCTRLLYFERYEDIRNVERYLARNGVVIRKFFLHVSEGEQKKRFLDRIHNPAKNWKFSSADSRERGFWKDYMDAYEQMIRNTATEYAPWYVIPADNKWFTRVAVAAVVIEALASLDLQYPEVSEAQLKELAIAEKALNGE